MENAKVGLYFFLTADMLSKALQKHELSSTDDMNFVRTAGSDWLLWQPKD